MKIVLVNSTGPMGSTVVGSLIEKFDFINIPLRKLGLHDYLVGMRDISDPFFLEQFTRILDQHCILRQTGGVSVRDRNIAIPRKLVDKDLALNYLASNSENLKTIRGLYNISRNAYSHAIQYKKTGNYSEMHVEYTTDIINYNMEELEKAYNEVFDEVIMIHLHRDFVDWLESLFSQRFIHPKFKTRNFFVLHSAYNQYMRYEEKTKNLPGLHVEFKSLFLPNTKELINDISKLLKMPIPNISFENEQYDLYGKLSDFDTTFTQADTENLYLSKISRSIIKRCISRGKITIFHDILVYGLYLIESFRFQINYHALIKVKNFYRNNK